MAGTSDAAMQAHCGHCGMMHGGPCPRVKAIEYHPNGEIKRVEYHDPRAAYEAVKSPTWPWPTPGAASTSGLSNAGEQAK